MMIIAIIIAIVFLLLVWRLMWWNDKLYSEIESINIKLRKIREELDTNSHLIRQNTFTINDMKYNVNRTMCDQHYTMEDFEKSTKEEIENIKKQITEPYKII